MGIAKAYTSPIIENTIMDNINIQNRSLIAVGSDGETYEFQVRNSYEFSTKGQKLKIETNLKQYVEGSQNFIKFAFLLRIS